MELVNPVGRTVNENYSLSGSPKACVCGTWGSFANAQGGSDHCFRCGCDCTSSPYSAGNRQAAFTSPWASK